MGSTCAPYIARKISAASHFVCHLGAAEIERGPRYKHTRRGGRGGRGCCGGREGSEHGGRWHLVSRQVVPKGRASKKEAWASWAGDAALLLEQRKRSAQYFDPRLAHAPPDDFRGAGVLC